MDLTPIEAAAEKALLAYLESHPDVMEQIVSNLVTILMQRVAAGISTAATKPAGS